MKPRILILEDDENRIRQFKENFLDADLTFTTEAKECIQILEDTNVFDYIFLDHDLGGQQMVASGKNTGYEVACWLEEHKDKLPKYRYCHSLNPTGRSNINVAIKSLSVPFAWTQKICFKNI